MKWILKINLVLLAIIIKLSLLNACRLDQCYCYENMSFECNSLNKSQTNILSLIGENDKHFIKISINQKNFSILPGFFIANFSVKWLDLTYNEIEIIPEKSFSDTIYLENLVLSKNRIKTIDGLLNSLKTNEENFKHSNLSEIVLDNNQIEYLPKVELHTLKILRLQYNNIKILKNHTFIDTTLIYLFLYDNKIEFIELNAFSGLFDLKILKLQRNRIELIQQELFKDLIRLEFLDLSMNKIREIENFSFRFITSVIFHLYLNGNKLVDLKNETFYGLNPYLIDFANNELRKVEPSILFYFKN